MCGFAVERSRFESAQSAFWFFFCFFFSVHYSERPSARALRELAKPRGFEKINPFILELAPGALLVNLG